MPPRHSDDPPPTRRRTPAKTAAPRTAKPRDSRRAPSPATEPLPAQRSAAAGLAGLFRGAGSIVGQVSGIDAPARALDRLAASAERAADYLDRLDEEVGIERVLAILERLDGLVDTVDDTHRALLEIERVVLELYGRAERATLTLDRIPLPRRRRKPPP